VTYAYAIMKLWEQLFIVKKHQIKMMMRRGYTVPDAALLDYTYDQFEAYYKQALSSVTTADAPVDLFDVITTEIEHPRKALVWYTPQQNRDVPVDDIREMIAYITEDDGSVRPYREIIVISAGRLSSKITQQIDVLEQLNVHHFTYQEMSYDPTHHFLAVPHQRLRPQEAKDFLNKAHIQASQLPTILASDPIVKYYGWPVNSILRVKRTSVIGVVAPETVFYRRVVPAPPRGEK
jgi:DNA-directed RNA polymerase subunit H (RpoH/RPB5)